MSINHYNRKEWKEERNMEKEMEIQENKMGIMPENKLLLSMSLPMMISMLVQALYNIVDSIFVSRINENALTAVSLAFPIQSLMIAFGAGTGVGINALLSKSLGEKNYEKVLEYTEKVINSGDYELHTDYDELFRPQSDGANKEMRARHFQYYCEGKVDSEYLKKHSPFVWMEANRQHLL